MVPRTVLTRSGPISLNTARPVNTVQPRTTVNNARPMKNVINNAYSTARRPFNKITTANNSNFTKKVNTVKGTRVNTARPKAVLSAVKGNKGNAVKASACWVWRPKHKVLDHGNPQQDLKDKGVIDSGCSRHMTGNRSYLTDYEKLMEDLSPLSKDETSEILKTFIRGVENLINLKVKVIRCDNGTEFKNRVMNQFCEMKGIKREFIIARTPQQNRVAGVSIKPQNKTPYELFLGRKHALSFMRPFGCPVTILNTIDHQGSGPKWLFDIDALTNSMNYKPVVAGNQSNSNAGTKTCNDAGKARMETVLGKDYILLPIWPADLLFSQDSKSSPDAGFKPSGEEEKKDVEDPGNESGNPTKGKDSETPSTEEPRINQEKNDNINITNNINTASDGNSTNNVNAASLIVNVAGSEVNVVDPKTSIELPNDPNMPELEDIIYSDDAEDVGVEANMNNLDTFMLVWTLMDLPNGKRAIGTKWVYKNKKDERVAIIEAIRLFLAYASFKDFMVYQMDVKSAFLYGKIKEEVYVCQPLGFEESSKSLGANDENPPPPPVTTPTQQASHTVSTIKLPILKKGVSTEDANQKFLRSLHSSWSQVSLIMRTKPGVDSLSFDDLYKNLRLFETDVKGSTRSSSSTKNVAFVSSESTSNN
ncbi:ribonuclease H-like domain-containing protein [Tanacetum coccineum]